MATATITSKGQITLPKSVRTKLGVEAGHRVEFIETDAGFLVKSATRDIRALTCTTHEGADFHDHARKFGNVGA
jgi:AbrB family looped-hinge helix DNA binding protein